MRRALVAILALCACGTQAARPWTPAAATATAAQPAPTPAPAASADRETHPATEHHPVTDDYQGVSITDDYRWLEDGGGDAVRSWSAAQNAYARSVLDGLPGRAQVAARVRKVLTAPVTSYPQLEVAGGRWFVLLERPPRQQPFLAVMPAGGDPAAAKVVLDPNALDPSGKTAIDFYVPSPDGRRVAVSLSKDGTENGEVHVIDVETGADGDRIPRVTRGTAGGDLAWSKDGKGFYYTRYPAPGERPAPDLDFYQQLYFHPLGSDAQSDRYELGKDFPRIAEIRVQLDARSGRVLASVQKGDGGQFAHYLKTGSRAWRQLTHFEDGIVQVAFGPGDDLFAVSRRGSPRGVVLRVSGKSLDFARARTLLAAPENQAIVTDFWGEHSLLFGKDRWYATFQIGGPSVIHVFDYAGKELPWKAPLDIASVRWLVRDGDDGVLFRAGSFVDPAAWYRYDERAGALERTRLVNGEPIYMRSYRVVREQACSGDGTLVPVNIILPANAKLDGSNRCVVTGYGGYGMNLEPRYEPKAGLWLEQGVIYAVANLRGGGEYGEDWHRKGSLEHKQNVFDDFAAVLRHVIERGYTTPEHLGIIGGSNGGLLMGATLVQHPELVHAVVSFSGIYDMLRAELSPNGAFNVTEFGSVTDPVQLSALLAYSPYHHVSAGVAYPRALLLNGENDPRVEPMQSRKMIARLQTAGSGGPFLLRTSQAAGHGGSNDLEETVAQTADAMTFMLAALRSSN